MLAKKFVLCFLGLVIVASFLFVSQPAPVRAQSWVEIPLAPPVVNATTSIQVHAGKFQVRGSAASDQELREISASIAELEANWNDRVKAVRVDCFLYPDTSFELFVDASFTGASWAYECPPAGPIKLVALDRGPGSSDTDLTIRFDGGVPTSLVMQLQLKAGENMTATAVLDNCSIGSCLATLKVHTDTVKFWNGYIDGYGADAYFWAAAADHIFRKNWPVRPKVWLPIAAR